MKSSKERDSNMELLRIISMLMIMLCHVSSHGCSAFDSNVISVSRLWCNFIAMGGNIGTAIFVLISGYYLIKDDSPVADVKRVLKLAGCILFYSVLIFLILYCFRIIKFSWKSAIKALFPLTYSKWWFASAYFVLYLLHPYLNILIRNATRNTLEKMLLLAIVCWSIIPTFTASGYQSNNLLWLVTLYCIAAYIRIYNVKQTVFTKQYALLAALGIIMLYTTSIVIMLASTKISALENKILFFYGRQSVFILFISVMLFLQFRELSIGCNKWINRIASTTFGVYLIHDNPDVREWLWTAVFPVSQHQNKEYFVIYSICIVGCTFVLCSIIDLLRQETLEKVFTAFLNRERKE